MSRRFLVPLLLPADPAAPLEAATKQYVDALAGAADEVWIGPSEPPSTSMVWFDTDENGVGGVRGVVLPGTDWNTIQTPGMYTVSSFHQSQSPNCPPVGTADDYGILIVSVGGFDAINGYKQGSQVYYAIGWEPQYWHRTGTAPTDTNLSWDSTWNFHNFLQQRSLAAAGIWSFPSQQDFAGYWRTQQLGAGIAVTKDAPIDAESTPGLLINHTHYDLATETYSGASQLWFGNIGTSVLWYRFKAGDPNASWSTTPWVRIGGAEVTFKSVTATTYSFVAEDRGKFIEFDNASPIAATVSPDATLSLPVGAQIDVAQLGAGQVTFVAGAGVTLRYTPTLKLRVQNSSGSLIKRAANDWWVLGDLALS